jgi:hypothetical protein
MTVVKSKRTDQLLKIMTPKTNSSRPREIRELSVRLNRFVNTDEYKNYFEIMVPYQWIYGIYLRNFDEYNRMMVMHNEDSNLFEPGYKKRFDVLNEISRLTFNYLSSARSLSLMVPTHTEKFFGEDPFFKMYETKVSEQFRSDPLSQFIKDLRNFQLKRTIPTPSSYAHFRTGHDSIVTVRYYKDELLEGTWNALAREYITQHPGEMVDVYKAIKDYHDKNLSFYEWYETQILTVKKATFSTVVNALDAFYEEALEKGLENDLHLPFAPSLIKEISKKITSAG